nr:hypothetical protein [Brevundimonas aurantiaca]
MTLLLGTSAPVQAQAPAASEAQVAWRLLDYVSVDYAGAVANGQIVNPAEYGEMTEFAGQIRTRIDALPATTGKAALVRDAAVLETSIRDKAAPEAVAARPKPSPRRCSRPIRARWPRPSHPISPGARPSIRSSAPSATASPDEPTARRPGPGSRAHRLR